MLTHSMCENMAIILDFIIRQNTRVSSYLFPFWFCLCNQRRFSAKKRRKAACPVKYRDHMWDDWFIKLIAVENVIYTYRCMYIFMHMYINETPVSVRICKVTMDAHHLRHVTLSKGVQCCMSGHLRDSWWTAVCKITEWYALRGSSGDHMAQPPPQNRVNFEVWSGFSRWCPGKVCVPPRMSPQMCLRAPVPVHAHSHRQFLFFLISNGNFFCCNLNLLLVVLSHAPLGRAWLPLQCLLQVSNWRDQ